MIVQFVDGRECECSTPVEQRSNITGLWKLVLNMRGIASSNEFDSLITAENTRTLKFLDADRKVTHTLHDYVKIESAIIRYGDTAVCDVHFTRKANPENE